MLPTTIFKFFRGVDLMRQIDDLPDRAATYIALIRDGDRLLDLSGYFDIHSRVPYRRHGRYLLYTGYSQNWGQRVRRHLKGDVRASTLRRTLLSLEHGMGLLSGSGIGPWTESPDLAQNVQNLTDWMARNATFGVCECSNPKALESAILDIEPSPLNIDQRRWDSYARKLIEVRIAQKQTLNLRQKRTSCRF